MGLKSILENDRKNLFSFYIVSGESDKNRRVVASFLKEYFSFNIVKNSDFYFFSGRNFAIDTSREIKKIVSMTGSGKNGMKVFFLDFLLFDVESQNAMLKTFEESTGGAIFFLFLPNTQRLLETTISRARVLRGGDDFDESLGLSFLKADYPEREKIVKNMESDDFLNFWNSLDQILILRRDDIEDFLNIYKEFSGFMAEAQFRGAGNRYMLTYLSIVLPRI